MKLPRILNFRSIIVKNLTLKTLRLIMVIIIFSLNCVYASEVDVKDDGFINIGGDNLPIQVIQKAGNDNENFVILFLADGYTKNDSKKFLSDVSARTELMLNTEPFKSYSHKINIYAIPTVSNEAGASYYDSVEKDTYFKVTQLGKAGHIGEFGINRAKEIKTGLEDNYLDIGGVVGTIHILSNSSNYFGASSGTMLSCASNLNASMSIHEIAHSIGKLKDEYGEVSDGVNASKTDDIEKIEWKEFLGFRGVGITLNGQHSSSFVPGLSCIMADLDYSDFCEVCKAALVRRLNLSLYTQVSDKYYIAEPDITTEHNKKNTINNYNEYRINQNTINKANGHDLEFRTIVQNLEAREQNFSLIFKITGADGKVKYEKEETFTIPPYNENNYNESCKSFSVTFGKVSGLVRGDEIYAVVKDNKTNTVATSHKMGKTFFYKVNIRHKTKDSNGVTEDMPNVSDSSVYLPMWSIYRPKPLKQINGHKYIGNSLNDAQIILSDNIDMEFYYKEEIEKPKIEIDVSDDGKTFTIIPTYISDGSVIVLALYNGDMLAEIKSFVYDGKKIIHKTDTDYLSIKAMAWSDFESIQPICRAVKKPVP